MFGSNVQPKRIVKMEPAPWYCHHCNEDVPRYLKKCPSCNQPRNS